MPKLHDINTLQTLHSLHTIPLLQTLHSLNISIAYITHITYTWQT